MNRIWVVALLVGCAAQPEHDRGLLDHVARKTPEQIRAEHQQDIEAARQALEYQAYVCSLPEPERRDLIEKTAAERNWRLICKD